MILEQPQVIERQIKLSCKLLGHKLHVIKNYQQGQKEYSCKWCKNKYTDLDDGKVDLLTPKLHHLNVAMEQLYMRKLRAI